MQSVQRVVSDGTLQIVDLSITYFDRSEINVYVNAAPYTDWHWASDVEDRIIFNSPIPAGVEVLIKRTTDLSKLRHYFSKGSAFTAEALDEDLQQVLHIAQEATEASLTGDFYTDIDMHGHRVKNIGQAVDDSDALTLRQYKQDAQGAFVARNQAEQFKNEAASYAGSAQTSANNSAASAQDSLAAARSAQTYATSAAASASAAAQSEANAAASASAAAASFDAFDDRYLGAKSSDPATDNDGNALQVGALYWNTTANEMRVWTGSSWRVAAGSLVGNADTATKLQTPRTITIGNTGKSFDGSANVSWSLAEILGNGVPATAQVLGSDVDLNTITTPGFYVQFLNANAASGTNYPIAQAGSLVVLRNAGGVSQLYYTYGDMNPRAFFRAVYIGSWTSWREIYHSGNLALPIGVGQTWQDVAAQRALNTTYTNTTGRPIMVAVCLEALGAANADNFFAFFVDGVVVGNVRIAPFYSTAAIGARVSAYAIVPAGSSYRVNRSTGSGEITYWSELR